MNDNLHLALKKYDQISARVASSNQDDDLEDRQYSGRRSTTQRSSLSSVNNSNQVEDEGDDDPFAEFVRARAGSSHSVLKSSASTKDRSSGSQKPEQSNQADDDDEDDPFASFVQQRAAKILGSESFAEEKKPAAPKVEKNLIDLWDGAY